MRLSFTPGPSKSGFVPPLTDMPLPSGPPLLTLTRVYWLSLPVVESVMGG